MLPPSRDFNLAVWLLFLAAFVVWQLACTVSDRLPSFGHVAGVLMTWWPTRWLLLLGWFWLGWHFFVRGSW